MFAEWVRDFEDAADRRRDTGDPDFARRAVMAPEVVASVRRFQVGESGDGANLIAKAGDAGDDDYARAVRMFVAEERDHARMLALLLGAAGRDTIAGHWSDAVFVRLRRVLGLRMELMVLLIAEVVALGYYRALRDGADDPLVAEVAGRILDDERRHVPFHCLRLRGDLPRTVRGPWRVLLLGALAVVCLDHGPALRRLGVTRRAFAAEVIGHFDAAVAAVHDPAHDLLPVSA
ncbi:ferritin-like domain-containing protein [Saccharothrix violaceirubra]|uniref:ferritin-like domain-containing protein n=1 Tax=Saccharothrix violaceirubra TaxID=413306 RepID=UPI0028B136CF|nr:ferritin-like domain-containing protein [Saccharothrix violaceirubra]